MIRALVSYLVIAICTASSVADSSATKEEKEAGLLKRVTIENSKCPASLEDILLLLHEQTDAVFLLDSKAFEKRGIKDIRQVKVCLAAQKDVELCKVLQDLLRPLGATFKPTQRPKGFIEIVPEGSKNGSDKEGKSEK